MKKGRLILISLAAALLVTALAGAGVLRRQDKWTQDALCQHRGVTSKDIIIIGIDETAISELGPYSTWDRTVMASALEALAADPEKLPAVTAIDVLYTGDTTPEADERLAKAAEKLGNMVTAVLAEFGEEVTWEGGRAVSVDTSAINHFEQPYEALQNCTVQGHINAMTDTDGVMRHALLYIEPEGERVYSMASEAARIYLEQNGRELTMPPISGNGYFYVSYTSPSGGYYDGISIAQLIAGKVPPAYWAGKIVLIGPYAPAMQDSYFTTIDKGTRMNGVEIQANVIQSLIEGKYMTELPQTPQLVVLFLLSFAAMMAFLAMKVLAGGGLCAGLMLLSIGSVIAGARAGLIMHPLWLPAAFLILYMASLVFHYMRAAKERQILALENERIGAELALASRIQENSLPKEFPPFPERKEFDIYASMNPAKEVGGDLYDFFLIDEDHLGMVIGDVSGKGVPAALFMMVAVSLIHNAAMADPHPASALAAVNRQICRRNPEDMFVTVWLGILEISTGKLAAANAGHEYPVLKKPDGHFEVVKDRHGLVIGGMDGVRYREYELQMEPGSKLFVYTDGVVETINPGEEQYGMDRMLEALQSREEEPLPQILDGVFRSTQEFAGSAPQFDDLTMLCLQYNGK